MELVDQLDNYYLEFDGKGASPRDWDLDDYEQRKRGVKFRMRQEARKELDRKQTIAINKLRN